MYHSYANAIDELLQHFDKRSQGNIIPNSDEDVKREATEIKELAKRFAKKYHCSESEIRSFIFFLEGERMIDNLVGIEWITFKGRDFIKQGGYSKIERDKRWSRWRERATTFIISGGALATIVIAVSTIVKDCSNKGQPPSNQCHSTSVLPKHKDTLSTLPTLSPKLPPTK